MKISHELSCLPSYPAPIDEIEKLSLESDPDFIEKINKESHVIWKEIHENLKLQGDTVPIAVYGSLMSPSSAAHTLANFKTMPVWLYGYTRFFNLDQGFWRKSFHSINGARNRGVLSLVKDQTKRCNAIILEMSEEDFVAARKREECYRLVPVKVCSYPYEESCSLAYVFVAEEVFCSKDILPLKEYYYLVWSAVSSTEAKEAYGKDFAKDFLETSFLANGDSVLCIHSEYQENPQVEYVTPTQNQNSK
ncbi:gamma-glutamylcyclotransferase family protein [Chlamydia sp. 17-3921]|uniref:gamma-glutamylcyclotransferase family protein n=1 Tax=Chlamydia sp. 17-3921 TaxID=2675798 RepID=UPI001919E2D8|nr:gamma-glutamylcyclotransferase family protein [Chlamydia sp. 17-3921]